MQIDLEQIETWSDDKCREVWPQLAEAYTPAISWPVRRRLNDIDSPRRSLLVFAQYFNGSGKDRVLRRRKQLELHREFAAVQAAVAKLFHVPESELKQSGRHPRVVATRMFITHIMHKRGMSYPDICERLLGHTAHASVITADQRLKERMANGDTFETWDGEGFVQMSGGEILKKLTNDESEEV